MRVLEMTTLAWAAVMQLSQVAARRNSLGIEVMCNQSRERFVER
uniref:Uncharacterized protein n=1 Tax=Pseudomonas fluorescens TaxID=294 RepID=A0A5E6R0Y0_PSEFL|nr:hypothetical protein PS652_01347 [Pseudomonas fluorescens]